MSTGLDLHQAGDPVYHVHFPTDSVIAPLHAAGDEQSAQIAVIGNEGMSGCGLFLCGEAAPRHTLVQCAGHAFRLRGGVLHEECSRSSHFYTLLLRYTQALVAQMAQTVACNLEHSLEQRLCRWLLLTLDRVPSHQFQIEHEVVEMMMGETCERIGAALRTLDVLGVIRRSRTGLTVPDRRALELASCACYATVRQAVESPAPAPRLH